MEEQVHPIHYEMNVIEESMKYYLDAQQVVNHKKDIMIDVQVLLALLSIMNTLML